MSPKRKSTESVPPKKTPGRKGRWVDPLIVPDEIRFGINTFRPEPPEPDKSRRRD